ncbi:phosphopantetheinyl transferase [Xanthomonas oryzae pv. oryzae]|uniref:Enterobactin synthase component D n=1 Tax=Xanthomonas oryzae pv. oryzae TaxID=64187 RepID=A0A854CHP4_XANOO|nr:4'-phosphopantetheinyl transferase superfamily protein [Xanthomonas oryzae]BAE69691.1 putative phosphopantetheinyl transferase [Xanthomonas oryzae pv. oryzae MAFF 311018]AOS04668.1 phosphopantetheinyl transferase [Xanthomonas oryzae pv. oryzae]AOS21297.1 phosphopantetheinyl transferase [Xanthomonas oryzae pv. oryzae]AOS25464.1 phosphopantetheinyl transferase [Xanthomonas oryzae pv. oryzae]AOS29643.1 phosphopantetheinyl transferase [Xanthomonas oryzae pv. oryzae]
MLLERIAPERAAHGAVPGLQAHWQSALPCPAGEHLVVQAMDFASDQFSRDAFARCAMACPPGIVRSVRKRQAEYFFGRLAARHALHQQGLVVHPDTVQIATGNAREPIWPKTAVGSISHTHRLAMSAVAPADRWRGIGIDLEHLADPDAQAALRARVVNASELALLQTLHDAGDATLDALLTLVFSAKESLFKASFAVVGRYFDFSAEQVTGVNVAAGCLQLRLCESLCPSLPADHLCPVGFGWVDPQTVVTYRVW